MKLLAWDTSSKAGAIVALEWDPQKAWSDVRQAGEWSLNVDSQHSERLLWGVHQMLESARWRLDEIDVFAVGVGPGSFTGLRIGITTARTLAHSLRKPLVGVSSLAALARPAALWLKTVRMPDVLLVASTDACKGELFSLWGKASSVAECVAVPLQGSAGSVPLEGSAGLWKRDVQEEVLTPENLVSELETGLKRKSTDRARDPRLWLAVGEGRKRYAEAWSRLPEKRELRPEIPFCDQVQGRYLGMLAWEAWKAGLARPALEVHPRYVRASDAELKLKSGVLKRAPEGAPV